MYRAYCSGVRWSSLFTLGVFSMLGNWLLLVAGIALLAVVDLALELPLEIERELIR